MRSRSLAVLFVLFVLFPLFPLSMRAQKMRDTSVAPFFASETPLAVTLTTNIKRIRGDRDANAPYRAATLTYADKEGKPVVVPVRIRTRGIWRLKTCEFPPLRLNFTSEAAKHTVFKGLDKPKLVNFCRNDDTSEEYLLREFQLYRIYRLLTPASHAVRLVRMTYVDSASGKPFATRYAFMEEDPAAVAARMGGKMLKITGAGPNDLVPEQTALVGLFQYLIGNTDFALSALHNSELLGRANGEYWPVVYDFDFSGAVNARYATPDPRLHIVNVRERVYRGFCVPPEAYPPLVARFDSTKSAIYGLYRDSLGKLLRPQTVDETLRYFDDFYRVIDDPRELKSRVIDACLGRK